MNKNKNKSMSLKFEIRSVDSEQGIFEGYASVFGVVDTYGTSIQRGAFAKTLRERGDKIKVLFNHDEDEPIGKPLEMREDDHGLFVRAQLVRGVQKAEEALLLMKSGVINTLSIGFSVPNGKDTVVDGVRQIHEVKLYEFSPVVFESNSAAAISSVRSKNFEQTVQDEHMERGHQRLFYALEDTLMDIWWGEDNADTVVSLITNAIDSFSSEYKKWAAEYAPMTFHGGDEYRAELPANNKLAKVTLEHMRSNKLTVEKLAMNTTLTIDEARQAKRGELSSSKMESQLGDVVATEYRKHHRAQFEKLAAHLRTNMNAAERSQLSALLNIQPSQGTESHEAAPEPHDMHSINQLSADIKKMMETL